jgi:7-cyano-7-deazaguanine synthase in queuosine biosynthesis
MNEQEDATKRPLVLFSGGIDSTYLVQWYLENGNSVDTLYVHASQHQDKVIKEMHARVQLFKKFTEIYAPADAYDRRTDVIKDFEHNLDEQFVKTVDYAMVQPISWLMAALIRFDHRIHSELAIGYLLGDQAPAFYSEIVYAWNNLWVVLHGRTKAIPPIRFPLLDGGLTKYDVMKRIDKRLAAWTWVCEMPRTRDGGESDNLPVHEAIYACNSCKPCRLMNHTIADLDADEYFDEPGQGWLYWVDRAREDLPLPETGGIKKKTLLASPLEELSTSDNESN